MDKGKNSEKMRVKIHIKTDEDEIDFSPLMDPKKADLLFSKILESIITIGG